MTDGVSSIQNSSMYQFHYERYLKMKTSYGGSLTFEQYLDLTNVGSKFVLQKIENYVETGNQNNGDGISGNTLSYDRHVDSAGGNSQMFQTEDRDGFLEIDWDNGTVGRTTDVNKAAAALGIDTENMQLDTIAFGYGTGEITDFVFNGLDDGQDRSEYDVRGSYNNIRYAVQEFDPCYILNSALQNPSDPEYKKALANWEYLSATASQWMSDADLNALAELDPDSAEYKEKLLDIMLDKLDQTSSFGDHDHVKPSGSVDDSNVSDGNLNNGDDGNKNNISYDKDKVLDNAGLLSDYTSPSWKSEFINRSDKSQDEARNLALGQSAQYAESVLQALEKSLIAELGSSYNDEVQKWIAKAKKTALASKEWQDYTWHGAWLNKNKGFTSTCDTKKLVDSFYKEFDQLCASGGKSSEQVEKDNAEKEKYKEDYKTFYNFNIKSASLGVEGVKSEYTIPQMSGDYKKEAKDKVLTPFASKITSAVKSKCSSLSESQIKAIVDKALNNTLNDDSWLSTNGNISNGGTYSIDTDKLLDSFSQCIKDAIVSAGYDPNA